MMLVLTLLVRDEVDIIKGMLDYHLASGVDHIIITDNGSTDGTYEICKDYEISNAITLLTESPSDFSQHRWVSRMANLAHDKLHADWIIHADADELFLPVELHHNLKETLKKIPKNISVLHVPRHDFVSIELSMQNPPQVEMIYRKNTSLNIKGKPLTPKVIHRGSPNVIVTQGNHSVTGDNLGKPTLTKNLLVYHYPIRSYHQFYSKVSNGGSGYARNKELGPNMGFHKRYWYNLLTNNVLSELYYKEYLFTPEKLERAIKNNEIIEDRRIAYIFDAI